MESLSTQVARIVYLSYNLILCTIFKKSEEASSASKTIVKGMWVQRHTWSNMYTEQHKHVLPCHFALQVLLKNFKDIELAQDFLVLQEPAGILTADLLVGMQMPKFAEYLWTQKRGFLHWTLWQQRQFCGRLPWPPHHSYLWEEWTLDPPCICNGHCTASHYITVHLGRTF